MRIISVVFHRHGPLVLRLLAMLALAAGLGIGVAVLLAPRAVLPPPALSLGVPQGADTTAIAAWFGGSASRARIRIAGLISGGEQGVALLAVNGGAVTAYRVGQTLAPGVSVDAILPNAVAIDQDGVVEQVQAPKPGFPVVQGFVPVSGSRSGQPGVN